MSEKRTYPYIGRYHSTGTTVLFQHDSFGYCLQSNTPAYQGTERNDWIEKSFTPINRKILGGLV